MKYLSSRGLETSVTFRDVLFAGYSKDGGLYFPEAIPRLTEQQLTDWSRLTYQQLLTEILCLYVDPTELDRPQITDAVNCAFSRFDLPEVMRLAELEGGLRVSELFHGPTLAFKDLGLGVVGQLVQRFLARSGERCIMLVGTSGDTGSAAIQAVTGLDAVDIVVLLPKGRCTKIQELQMTTCISHNVHIFTVDGNSDELDEPIKACFADLEFVAKHGIISTNSINWARIVTQMTHFFYGYFRTCERVGDVVEMVLPTGAGGNITAGCVAARMGLPIQLVASVTKNDIVHRTLSTGDFSRSDAVLTSLAPAMDIQAPYNVERLLLLFSDYDTGLVKSLMSEFEDTGSAQLSEKLLTNIRQVIKGSHVASDEDILSAIRRCWSENHYALCPHTATAAHYHYTHSGPGDTLRRVCVATAGPDKFPEALTSAGVSYTPCQRILALSSLPTRSEPMHRGQDWEQMLREKIKSITASRNRD